MGVNKKKKTLKLAMFSSFFVASTATVTAVTLVSCANNNDWKIPSSDASTASFTDLSSTILPTVAGVLSSKTGQESLIKSYVNELLLKWFGVVNESSIETSYKEWSESAEKSYKNDYDNYKSNRGSNWAQLFQQNVLDPAGGTKEDLVNDKIIANLKTKFIDNLFGTSSKEYLAYKSSDDRIIPVKEMESLALSNIENTYVNASTAGQKNNFLFTGEAIFSGERKTIDYGYADFMEYLMDSWIKNALPLPLSMSLWKNGTSETKIQALFSNYFTQNSTPEGFTEGSYKFQYFEPINNNDMQTLTTTTKFNLLMNRLANGSYVGNTTGLIKLNNQYTEDSSTVLIVPSSKLFDGTYVTPFSAAAWYKFSNEVFGITDENVYTLSQVNPTSIMKNFLYYPSTRSDGTNETNTTNGKAGVFEFPYDTTWKNTITQLDGSVFLGEYEKATGIRDTVNIASNATLTGSTSTVESTTSKLGNFILTRNTFGVHLIGIDRLSKLKEAYSAGDGSATNDFSSKFNAVLNELRNTFIYYLALDSKATTSTYNVKDSLKTYLTDNFESIIYGYVKKLVDNPSTNVNSLFGAKVTANMTDATPDYSSNFGFVDDSNGKSYKTYYDVLNQITSTTSNPSLRKLIDNAEEFKYARKAKEFNETLKNAIYENQSSYNSNTSATSWINNGIAGVLPYKRNGANGDFTSLQQLVNNIVSNTESNSQSNSSPNTNYYWRASIPGFINYEGSETTTITNTSEYFNSKKNDYQKEIVAYLNSINLVTTPKNTVGLSTYIFTNNFYVNKALLATGSDGTLNSIVYNSYIQKYIYPGTNGTMDNESILGTDNSTGSNRWISNQVKESIKSTYYVNKFVGVKNIYSEGDWTTYDSFKNKAEEYWNKSWNADEFNFSYQIGTNANKFGFNTYTTPSSSESHYKFLSTIRYLLTWNKNTNNFDFTRLHEILDKSTTVTNSTSAKAMIAWQNMSSIVANPDFGVSSNKSMADIQTQMRSESEFKSLPIYLTNSNSYSWLGQNNPYKLPSNGGSTTYATSDISYTTSTNYWYTAPMFGNSNGSTNTGFLGFQFEDTNESGSSNTLPSLAFDNETYSNALASSATSDTDNVKYRGMLYSYGTRQNVIDYVKNLSSVNLLSDFYNKNLNNSGLPVTEDSKKEVSDIIDGTESNRTELLQTKLTSILSNISEVPDAAFEKMVSMPLWNNDNNVNSTLFATSDTTQALKNEYVIWQFNNNDVKNLLVINESDETDIKLQTNENGFLGLPAETFFNAVVMLANSSSKLQNQANDAMLRDVGKIKINDIRLLQLTNNIGRDSISNYDDWIKIRDLK